MGRKSKVSDAQLIEMAADYEGGMTFHQVAIKFGVSDSVAQRALKFAGKKSRYKKISDSVINEWILLYESGLSTIEIGRKCGVNDGVVLNKLKQKGIKIRTLTHHKAPKLNSDLSLKLISSYLNDDSIQITDLCEKYNIGAQAISKLFKKNNIKVLNRNRKWHFNEDFFMKESWMLYYFYGFVLGDGCLFKSKNKISNRIQIQIHKKDRVVLESICDWIGMSHDAINEKVFNKSALFLSSHVFNQDLSKFGIVHNKTYEGVSPSIENVDMLKPFIVGLIDADGTIRVDESKTKYRRFSLTCSKIVVEWFIQALKTLGFDGDIKFEYHEGKCWAKANIYKHDNIIKIINLLEPWKFFSLKRKWNQLKIDDAIVSGTSV